MVGSGPLAAFCTITVPAGVVGVALGPGVGVADGPGVGVAEGCDGGVGVTFAPQVFTPVPVPPVPHSFRANTEHS